VLYGPAGVPWVETLMKEVAIRNGLSYELDFEALPRQPNLVGMYSDDGGGGDGSGESGGGSGGGGGGGGGSSSGDGGGDGSVGSVYTDPRRARQTLGVVGGGGSGASGGVGGSDGGDSGGGGGEGSGGGSGEGSGGESGGSGAGGNASGGASSSVPASAADAASKAAELFEICLCSDAFCSSYTSNGRFTAAYCLVAQDPLVGGCASCESS
jgi:hypothetical protein